MKCLYFLSALLLFSCTSGQKEVTERVRTNEADSVKKVVLSMMQGVWLKKDYAESVIKTRSPFKSSSFLTGPVTLNITDSGNSTDSLAAGVSINNHEGSEFWIYYRKGTNPRSVMTSFKDYESKDDFFELQYSTGPDDTLLLLNRFNEARKLLSSTPYLKVMNKPSQNDAAEGLNLYIMKKLFKGKYEVRNSSNKSEGLIELNEYGRTEGFGDYNNYSIMTDFVMASGSDNDVITFLKNEEDYQNGQSYLYSFSGDTLNLFKIKGKEEGPTVRGKQLYTLIRK